MTMDARALLPSGTLPGLLDGLQAALVAGYAGCQAALAVYSSHRWSILLRPRLRRSARPPAPAAGAWPRVTVQLPVYNERRVVERLIAAAARLDYPADRLELQVLDDSTDETAALAAAAVARWRAAGVDVRRPRRRWRT